MSTTLAADILFGKARRAVLALFFTRPGERFYLREIGRRTGTSAGAVQRELRQLVQGGILTIDQHGFYAVADGSPIVPPLRQLIMRTVGVTDRLRVALEPIASQLVAAFVFGSFADGSPGPGSDLDVMLIARDRSLTLGGVVPLLREVQSDLGREVNPFVTTVVDLRADLANGKPFVRRVMAGAKLWIMGSDDELGELAQERLAEKAPARPPRDRRPARRRRP